VAGRVPEHVIQQIARSVDFPRLVGRYCDLKKKGRKFWALCPFHKEKTPSFSVDAEQNLYYCFGCKEGGNAFTFLQKMEGMSFSEALKVLAAEAGVDLSRYRSEEGPSRGRLSALRAVNELAATFYARCLKKARGSEAARQYLAGRRISDESVELWRIGYAPEGWDNFLKCAAGRGYGGELVAAAGLALARQGAPGYYDRFRNRLIFPIADASGRTIGFGARALGPQDEPKYLNSPETALFSKGRCFFGLNQAKEAIRTGKTAVVMEGYTDVIMAHQEGVNEAVAVLGTAMTEEHARVLGRLCERVVLVFDQDEAGQKSAMRSIEVLLNEDIEIRVASLPTGQDPCDYIVAHGGARFRRRLDESQGFFEFRLQAARRRHGTDTVEGRMACFSEVADLALAVRDAARRDLIVRWLAQELGVRESSAWDYVRDHWRAGAQAASGAERDGTLSAESSLPSELLGLLLRHPELAERVASSVPLERLRDGPEKALLETIFERTGSTGGFDAELFLNTISDPELAAAAARAAAEERSREQMITASTPEQRLEDYLAYLDRKELASSAVRASADDEALRDYIRKLREKDRQSAQLKRAQEPNANE